MAENAALSLYVVSDELNQTLSRARLALEDAVEQRNSQDALRRCAASMHEARGVLQMVEVYGAALLAEEMEAAASHLAEFRPGSPGHDDGLDALTRSMVQLPVYLERMLAGGRDIALVLLPLLNDLRAVRGKPLLSESTLLLLNTRTATEAGALPARQPSGEDVLALAQKLRPAFQLALLGWIKGQNTSEHLGKLTRVADALERAAGTDSIHHLWWVVGGVLEALGDGGLATSVSIKRLLGQADREIKRLLDSGIEGYESAPPEQLLNNLLYYVARATGRGEKVTAIRRAFNLAELIPGDKQVEDARAGLQAPGAALMQTVAKVIREDLARVKDVLDIYVRTGGDNADELAPQLDLLKKISDTLGVLGLGDLRGDIQTEIARLRSLVDSSAAIDDATLIQIAATLLKVEDSLDRQLTSLVKPTDAEEAEPDAEDTLSVPALDDREQVDYQQVTHAVVRECLINLARLKEAVSRVAANNDDRLGIDSAGTLMRGVTAGLMMLGKVRAMEVSERILAFVDQTLRISAVPLPPEEMDRLADAVVSLEYYLETIQLGRRDPWYMLDNAEGCLDYLETLKVAEPQEFGETQRLGPEEVAAQLTARVETEVLDTPERPGPEIGGLPVVADGAEHIDPELLELFIEESREEIESIDTHLPRWAEDADDNEALITIRRSFHTLKGSGRMVGAERIGEFCWSIEDLLNRLINKTLKPTPPMVAFVRDAVAVLPDLVEQIEVGTEPPHDLNFIMSKAHAFAEGSPNAATMRPATTAADEVDVPEMDPVLKDIFSKEAANHIAAIREFLVVARADVQAPRLTEAVHRACHTLQGSANMANAERVLPLTTALNGYARRLYERAVGCTDDVLVLLSRASDAVESTVAAINSPDAARTDLGPLVEAITKASNALSDDTAANDDPSMIVEIKAPPAAAPPPAATLPPAEPPPAPPAEPPPAAGPADAFDAEIAEIFGEEATELLEASDEALQQLAAAADPVVPLQELKRHLHTLKGGARMAGIGNIGDLSHELESLLIAAEDQRVAVDDRLFSVLQRTLDELHSMRDTVVAGRMPGPAGALVREIQGHLAGDVVVGDAGKPAGVAANTPADTVDMTLETGDEPVTEDASASITPVVVDFPTGSDTEPGEVERSDEVVVLTAGEDDTAVVEMLTDDGSPTDQDSVDPNQTWAGRPPDFGEAGEAPLSLVDIAGEAPADEADEDEAETPQLIEDSVFEAAFSEADDDEFGEADIVESPVDPAETIVSLSSALVDPDTVAGLEALMEAGTQALDTTGVRATDDESLATDDALLATDDVAAETIVVASNSDPEPVTEATVDEPPTEDYAGLDDEPVESASPDEAAVPPPQRMRPGIPQPVAERQEFARVDADLLEELLNAAGEISIFHSRLSQQVNLIDFNLSELEQTVSRLRGQLRKLEIETEAQIINRHQDEQRAPGFDPLELDRYSLIQQLSRALAESASDVGSIKDLLQSLTGDADTLLVQQARVTAELQDGLMRTRMVPFSRHVARLTRLVRQTAQETGKQAELSVEGASGELDRQVLEKMLPPFEHMLRNAVVHGIETPADRSRAGKPAAGGITVRLHREGSEMVIDVADDGAGLDVERIRSKARERGLLTDASVSDAQIMELILAPGFSTADELTQAAGRGVGMDVVANEVKKLGGALKISSIAGQGTNFTIRLPFTLAITQALIARTGEEIYALPLPSVEGVARVPRAQLDTMLRSDESIFEYGERSYRLVHLGHLVGGRATELPEGDAPVPLVLVRKGANAVALLMDEMLASREIVVKSVGPQLAAVRGIAGATILGDGRVVLILDPGALIGDEHASIELRPAELQPEPVPDRPPLVLVVDDSITVRRVTERFLLRQGLRAVTAKDGIDAIARLEEERPAVILLDIEMPRMDGYEFASHVRNDKRVADTPIIMITSRVSEKHRAKAIEIGVNDYLGKPYQDHQLLETIRRYLPGAGEL